MVTELPELTGMRGVEPATLRSWREARMDAEFDQPRIARYERIPPRQFDRVRLPVAHEALRRSNDSASWLAWLFAYRDSLFKSELKACLPGSVVEVRMSSGSS